MHQQFISSDDVFEYLYNGIIKLGYTPTSDEILDIAEVVFDFLVDAGMVEEVKLDE